MVYHVEYMKDSKIESVKVNAKNISKAKDKVWLSHKPDRILFVTSAKLV